jgi:DNA-binding XRE family transcriptional regulator
MTMEEQMTAFGALLQGCRLAAGLSREALAERAGMSATAIGALERGSRSGPPRRYPPPPDRGVGPPPAERAALAAAVVRHRPPAPAALPLPAAPTPVVVAPLTPLTPLIGCGWDLAVVAGLLRGASGEAGRLVALTGPAGVGKTRLALAVAEQLAREFPEPPAVVDLTTENARAVAELVVHLGCRCGWEKGGSRPRNGRLALRSRGQWRSSCVCWMGCPEVGVASPRRLVRRPATPATRSAPGNGTAGAAGGGADQSGDRGAAVGGGANGEGAPHRPVQQARRSLPHPGRRRCRRARPPSAA